MQLSRKAFLVATVTVTLIGASAQTADACLFSWLFGCGRTACYPPAPCGPPPCAPSCAPAPCSPCGPSPCASGNCGTGFGPVAPGYAPTYAPTSPCGPGGCGVGYRGTGYRGTGYQTGGYQSVSPTIPPVVYQPRPTQTSFFRPTAPSVAPRTATRRAFRPTPVETLRPISLPATPATNQPTPVFPEHDSLNTGWEPAPRY
ncbi:hypothetical protein [Thalassoroseus pseudoceratinae]|uniref:hypothetical protein n=1 Tax=Thalassoroseus pseudoceratinae TaxID=2713176 RepID=UPI00141EA477|nr:hypothetical protein [Thalassoroseus pseudoceratinae]